jgi:hypothetical protein
VIVVTEPGRENEARIRLPQIGFDRVIAAQPGIGDVLIDHLELAQTAPRVTVSELEMWRGSKPALQIIDDCVEAAPAPISGGPF